jgi:LPXTG-site transpeptidase (sortase) family protein
MAKRKTSVHSKFVPELLLFVGVFLVSLSVAHNLIRLRSLRLDQDVVQEYLSQASIQNVAPNYPVHVTIPWFVDVDIDPQVYQNGSWTISEDHASYLTASALPGNPGNIIIYGHNKRSILGNIRALKGYEKITLTMAGGSTRMYQIESISEVSPSKTKLLSPTTSETLSIYTCSGLFDSQRFVVVAKPI